MQDFLHKATNDILEFQKGIKRRWQVVDMWRMYIYENESNIGDIEKKIKVYLS